MIDERNVKIIWQHINASKERNKILTGEIIAMETVEMNGKNINCAILKYGSVKIIIPANELNNECKNNKLIVRNMIGSKIRFVVAEIEREYDKAVASRIKALEVIKDINFKRYEEGDIVEADIVEVHKKYIVLECLGCDILIRAKDLQYGYVEDATRIYEKNNKIKVLIKEIDNENKKLKISIKDILKDPFTDIRKDFVEGGEYKAKVTGYADNGIYTNIAQGVDTLTTLPNGLNIPPLPGDEVIIKISKIIPEKRKIYSSYIETIKR